MSGTDLGYGAARCGFEGKFDAVAAHETNCGYSYLPTHPLCDVRYSHSVSAYAVRAAIVYTAICIRACYAMSGTLIADKLFPCSRCYAMSGTEIGYAATGTCEGRCGTRTWMR
eukprot:2008868-Rhodomonas_salina.4